MAEQEKNWERETLEKLSFAALKERKTARRWGIFFKLLTFAYVTFLLFMLFQWRGDGDVISGGQHTALVQLDGVIDAKGEASAEKINGALQSAFKDKNTLGVILRINSPGGSPVQSGIIHDEVRRLRSIHPNTPLYVVVEDVCASGGYFVAASADKIYVNKASLVGSIGVLMDGFGFTGGMDKLGVERRLLTAGENKGFMDPFSPVDPKQKEYALGMLNDIHQQFIAVVKQGRGKRLKDNPELFSGLVWTGQRSVELGLADGFGSVESVARDVIKAEQIVDYTEKSNPVERIAKRFGAAAAKSLVEYTLRDNLRLR
ncbi:MAG: S49 family peptidase [Betaproteobacteria bacterium]|nr:MAG: S49 family peptidase [Betaproteobacteria bacterium]